jgi:hypothetical protein
MQGEIGSAGVTPRDVAVDGFERLSRQRVKG